MSPTDGPLELPFTTLDVFTTTKFLGNPVAVVQVSPEAAPRLTQEAKQRVAREFNLSETVFLHTAPFPLAAAAGEDGEGDEKGGTCARRFDIFTIFSELPFAGHPTIGTACLVLNELGWAGVDTLVAKAGPIRLRRGSGRAGTVQAAIPHDVHVHRRTLGDLLLRAGHAGAEAEAVIAPALSPDPVIRAAELAAPAVSIVRGMSFLLVELPSLDHLVRIPTPGSLDFERLPDLLDEGPWRESFVARYYYVPVGGAAAVAGEEEGQGEKKKLWRGRARMVELGFEDPATGSAACTLVSYLTLAGKTGAVSAGGGGESTVAFEIVQGEEMGRRSEIELEVRAVATAASAGDGGVAETVIKEIFLGGSAVSVMKGTVFV